MAQIDTHRIDILQLAIREGEGRLASKSQTGKEAIRRTIANAKIRIERLKKGLPEGEMIFKEGRWMYEYEK